MERAKLKKVRVIDRAGKEVIPMMDLIYFQGKEFFLVKVNEKPPDTQRTGQHLTIRPHDAKNDWFDRALLPSVLKLRIVSE